MWESPRSLFQVLSLSLRIFWDFLNSFCLVLFLFNSKYGSMPLRGKMSHEMAIRLVLKAIEAQGKELLHILFKIFHLAILEQSEE